MLKCTDHRCILEHPFIWWYLVLSFTYSSCCLLSSILWSKEKSAECWRELTSSLRVKSQLDVNAKQKQSSAICIFYRWAIPFSKRCKNVCRNTQTFCNQSKISHLLHLDVHQLSKAFYYICYPGWRVPWLVVSVSMMMYSTANKLPLITLTCPIWYYCDIL